MTFLLEDKSEASSEDSVDAGLGDCETTTECSGEKISHRQTRDVRRIKLVVALVLIASAIGVALSAYLYVTWSEETQFERQFEDDSEKIFQAVRNSIDRTFGALDGLAVSLVSYARDTNKTWPFVTLPNFAIRMSKIVPFTDAFNVQIVPFVTNETRADWEKYAAENLGWIDEGVSAQEVWDGYHGPVVYGGTYNGNIHGDYDDVPPRYVRDAFTRLALARSNSLYIVHSLFLV
jgi:hypothetical protein